MSTVQATTQIADLRHRRRELRREIARIRWWRRLVKARRELTVARLADATTGDTDLDTAWEALAADAPTANEISAVIWADETPPTAYRLEALDAIDSRLDSYERRLSANLESVMALMVDAMGAAH
ncbi:MAG: hypothetical protein JW722_07075 [Demequinaceae bacterium]|nr:hypothetical protein [Demequinaceae bacterium]